MKKYLKYILIVILLLGSYKVADRLLDRMYLNQFIINDYTDDTRYTTVNKVVEKRFKKSDVAILVNTEYIDEVVSVSTYSYKNNIPVFYTERNKVLKPVYDSMKKLGVKKVIIMGGVNSLAEPVERSLVRNGYETDRVIAPRGVDFSIKIAELLAKNSKFDSIAIVFDNEFDLPNGISFSPVAQIENIPIIVTDNDSNNFTKIKNFAQKYNINNFYIISNKNSINSNLKQILVGNIIEIYGKDRYDVNVKVIQRFFDNDKNDSVFISKGGELLHKRHIGAGQLINAMAISPLAADNKAPLFLVSNNYFTDEESKILEKNGYKELNQVGFKIERRNYFNVERMKNFTTVLIIVISLSMAVRLFLFDKKTIKNT